MLNSRAVWLVVTLFAFCPSGALSAESKKMVSPWEKAPVSIPESVHVLEKILPKPLLAKVRESSERDLSEFHTSIGMNIRNYWLWGHKDGPLAKFFFQNGIHHPDDMSAIIIRCLRSDLRGEQMDLSSLFKRAALGESRQQDIVVESVAIPDDLANQKLKTTDGQEISLADCAGHICVLSLLSARDFQNEVELNLLNSIQEQFEKAGIRIIILVVKDYATDLERAKLFQSLKTTRFPVIDGGPGRFRRSLTNVLIAPAALEVPANIILGKDGKMIERFNGWRKNTPEELKKDLIRLMRERS